VLHAQQQRQLRLRGFRLLPAATLAPMPCRGSRGLQRKQARQYHLLAELFGLFGYGPLRRARHDAAHGRPGLCLCESCARRRCSDFRSLLRGQGCPEAVAKGRVADFQRFVRAVQLSQLEAQAVTLRCRCRKVLLPFSCLCGRAVASVTCTAIYTIDGSEYFRYRMRKLPCPPMDSAADNSAGGQTTPACRDSHLAGLGLRLRVQ